MSGQFDSELLNPDLQQEIATWDTLEQAYGGWSGPAEPVMFSTADAVADAPRDYIETWNQPETGFPTPAPAATDVYSTAEVAPLEQIYTPSPTLEQLYGGAPEQQMYQPSEFLYGGAPTLEPQIEQPLDTTPYFQPEQLDSWESPQNFTQNEWFSTVSGEDIGGGLPVWAEGDGQRFDPAIQLDPSQVVDTRGFFNSRNPQFLESNAQFDATTNPANRNGPGIVGGALNALQGAGEIYQTDIPIYSDFARDYLIPAVGQQMNAMNPLTWVDNPVGDFFRGGNEQAAQAVVPVSLGDVALTAAPVLGKFDDAGRMAERGFGGALMGTNLDTVGTRALDELPLKAAYAALDNPLQNPAFASDVANLAVGNLPRSLTGGAADDAARFLDQVIADTPSLEGPLTQYRQMFGDDAAVQWIAESGESKQAADARAFLRGTEEAASQAPITDLKSALREDLGIQSSMLDDVAPDVRQSLNLSPKGAPKDIIDDATEQVLRGDDYWPAPTPGSQPSLFGDAVQGFMEQAEGPNFYMPGPKAEPEGLTLAQQRLNRGLQNAGGNFDPNAPVPERGFLREQPTQLRGQAAEGPANYQPGYPANPEGPTLNQLRLNRGLQETAGNFDPNAVAPDSGFLRPQATNARMADAGGIPQYAPGPVAEAPEVSLNTLKLIRAAQENPSTSNLVAAVDALLPKVSGQMMLDLGDTAVDGRTGWQRITDELIGLIGAPRELKASFDQSIPGRQGLALAFRHPKEWVQSWKSIVPAWKSEEAFRIVNQDSENLITRWKQMVGEDGVVHLNSIDRSAPATERIAGFEAKTNSFASNVAKRLGTEKWERSAVAFINSQRTKTMDTMFSALWESGERNPKVYRDLSAIIDHATGYGAAPLKGDVASRLFFSQRFMTSRFQYLVDPIVEGVLKGDMNAARAATENLVAFAGGSAALLAMIDLGASQVGVDALDVEWDPRSSDFGKIRIGPQRIDFAAGFLPLIRSATQIGTGEKKTTTGDIIPIQKMNMDTLKKDSRVAASGNIALNFFRNKLDPVSGEAVTRFIAGEDPVGNKPTPIMSFTTLENLFAPLIASSTHEVLANGGKPGQAVFGAAAEFFGGSGSTYGAGQAAQQDTAQRQYGVDYAQLPAQYQAQINAGIENIPISDRLSAWWQTRDDAVQYLQSQLSDADTDPRYQAIRKAKTYQDVQVNLQRVYEGEYGMTRVEAEKEVAALMRTLFEDNIDAYRHDVMAVDPGFAKAWLDAYNARETRYEPPKWVKELAQGQ